MALPLLPLNLAPPPSLWRQRHHAFGWTGLGVGVFALLVSLGLTWRAYHQASRAGRDAVVLTEEAKRALKRGQQIQSSLQGMDVEKEQSRWKLAEKILQERSLPWSRIMAELEMCMVPNMRIKGIQRARGNGQEVLVKLKAEAKTREGEADFVEALRATPIFSQVVLEREAERTGGGWDFDVILPTVPVAPPFQIRKPKVTALQAEASVPTPTPARAVAKPAPVPGPTPKPAAPAPTPSAAPVAMVPKPATSEEARPTQPKPRRLPRSTYREGD